MLRLTVTTALAILGVRGQDPAGVEATPGTAFLKDTEYWTLWKDFKKNEKKEYETFLEHNNRFGIFKNNVDKINAHNAENHSWTMGITPFADLTAEEFKRDIVGGCTLKERDESNVVMLDDTSLPDSVDWDAQGKVTPVKNQGQCGSCWAFSTTGSTESRYAIAKGTLNSLSEQELVDCSGSDGNHGCNGGLMDYGFKYIVDHQGLCSEDSFKYTAKTEKLQCTPQRSACGAKLDPITSYNDVKSGSESQLAAAVADGPVSVAIEADQQSFQLYHKGIMSGRCGSKLDHGVLAVGYGTENGVAFWKVKNSWGATWGEHGYIRMCKDCGKNRGKGQCGIAGQPSYPVV